MSNKIEHFDVEITGTTPLLINAFTVDQAIEAEGSKSAFTGDRGTPMEQAEKKLYRGLDGKTLIIPQPNIFRCIIDAGTFFKAGKSKLTTQKSSLIPACLELYGEDNPIELPIKSKEPWTVDTRPIRNPATGGRRLCHRPVFYDWSLQFRLELDTEIMDGNLLRDVVDAAGKRIGLGDFRPACKGPFGKFKVTHWKKNGKGNGATA